MQEYTPTTQVIASQQDANSLYVARRFLETLFAEKPSGKILIWTLSLRGEKRSRWFDTTAEAALYAARLTDRNVYVGVGVSPQDYGENARCEAALVAAIPALWIDLDIASDEPAHKGKQLLPDVEAAQSLLRRFGIAPSLVVHSGHGLQAWWCLDQPLDTSTSWRNAYAADLARRFTEAFRQLAAPYAVDATQDLARVMRVPGTTNLKAGCVPAPVQLLDASEARYSVAEIEAALLPYARTATQAAPVKRVEPAESSAGSSLPSRPAMFSDQELLRKMFNSKHGSTISALYDNLDGGDASAGDMKLCLHLAFWTGNDASRMDRLFRESGRMRPKWDEKHYAAGDPFGSIYGEHTIARAMSMTSETYSERTPIDLSTRQPLGRGDSNNGAPVISTNWQNTDVGNAERFVALHGQDMRYCAAWKKWLRWDGQRWAVDDTGHVMTLAVETAKHIYQEAADASDPKVGVELGKWANRSHSKKALDSMVSLAQAYLPVTPDELDADHWLFNVQNGTIDLRTGELRAARREDYITKLAPITYDASAQCPEFLRFLDRILDGNAQLIAFVRKIVGYTLTGDTREQCYFTLYGSGSNGKSTLVSAVESMMGEYALHTSPDTFMVKDRTGGPNDDLAALKGSRLVTVSETEEGKKLAESRMKEITSGTDKVTARKLYGENFSFLPTFKVWMSTNHKPVIVGTDNGIWRRIRLIPFEVTIPEDERDKRLPIRLGAELSGILAWAIAGCLAWQKEGLTPPTEVANATDAYRSEMDLFGDFIKERLCESVGHFVPNAAAYVTYKEWCEESGVRPVGRKRFPQLLMERGYRSFDGRNGRVWRDLELA